MPVLKDHVLQVYVYMKCFKQVNLGRQKADEELPSAGGLEEGKEGLLGRSRVSLGTLKYSKIRLWWWPYDSKDSKSMELSTFSVNVFGVSSPRQRGSTQMREWNTKLHFNVASGTYLLQEFVAAALNVPRNRIACHIKRVGGGFGGKVTKPALLGAITAVAANK